MSMITEREWRRQAARVPRATPGLWGAQCVAQPVRPWLKDRAIRALMLLVSLAVAVALPRLCPPVAAPAQYPTALAPQAEARPRVREVRDIAYRAPEGLAYVQHTYTREQLLRGKLMLLDAAHPLPYGAPAPNTLSIATHGRGMVPLSGLGLKSGRETIGALARLFAFARGRGAGGLSVRSATLSPAEQSELRIAHLSELARSSPMDEAVRQTLAQTDAPGVGEQVQEYTVEIRLQQSGESQPDARPLGQTEQGRLILQNAWRFGFIQCDPDAADDRRYRFRYVGEAHATAMTYLDVQLEEYLELLHQKRALSVTRDGAVRYVVLCEPLSGTHVEFRVPEGATCDASLDNTGWAVAACVLGEE